MADTNLTDYLSQNAYQLGQNGQATGRYFVKDNQGTSHEVTGANAGHFQSLGIDPSKISTVDQFAAGSSSGANFDASQLGSWAGNQVTDANQRANANALAGQPATAGAGTPGVAQTPNTPIANQDPNVTNQAAINAHSGGAVAAQTAGTTPANLPTLANGQQAGGLQMPSGDAANSVYDPISGKQVSPEEAAFNATQASGKTAPQDSASASGAVKDAVSNATPPAATPTTTPAVDQFYNTNETIQQNATDLMNYFSPPETTKQLSDQLAKISSDNTALAGLNTQLMNINTVMSGTADDLRKEIQATGGMATESQVMALATARNKTLLQQATQIQNSITTAQNAVANDTTLFGQEKDLANNQYTQRTQAYQLAQTNYQNMKQAAKDTANTIIQAVGYQGYLTSLQAQGPAAVAAGESALGLAPGQLQQLVTTQQQQQNAAAIANSGVTTPFVNKNGEIQAQNGYAYTSEQDFFNKTGMTTAQAAAKGLISAAKPSLDIQAKQGAVDLQQGQIAQLPLDAKMKQAQINAANASAAASSASAAKTRLETQQLASGTGTGTAGGLKVSSALAAAINAGTIDPNKINSRTLGIYESIAQAGVDAVGSHAGAAGETKAVQDLVAYKSVATRTLGVIDKNLPLVANLADKVNTTGVPGLDQYIQGIKSYTGNNQDVVKYVNSLKTLRSEYAQMLAKGNTATDSDKSEAAQAIPSGLSGAAYNALGEQLKLEANNILQASDDAISSAKNNNASNNNTMPANLSTSGTSGTSGSLSNGITFKLLP